MPNLLLYAKLDTKTEWRKWPDKISINIPMKFTVTAGYGAHSQNWELRSYVYIFKNFDI